MAKYFSKFPKTLYTLANNNLDIVTNITSRFSFEKNIKQNLSAFYNYEIRDGDTPEILASKVYGSPERHWIILSFNNIVDPQFDWPLQYKQLNDYIDLKYSVVENVSIVQGGTGYSNGYITFETPDKKGKGANAVFTVNTTTGTIQTVTLFNKGSGYTQTPSYYISSNGQGAVLSIDTTISGVDWAKNNIKTYYKVEKQTIEDGTVTTNKYEISQNTYVNLEETISTVPLYNNKNVTIEIKKEYINYYDYELEENENKRSISILRSDLVNDLENELKDLFR